MSGVSAGQGFDVSVVIPARNAARWIVGALQSVAEQRLAAQEVLVIDDASTDDTVERVTSCGLATHVLRGPGGNAARARNLGIRAARGEWIAFLDADDVWYRDHLQHARARLGPGDVAYMANHDWLDQAGWPVPMPLGFHHHLPSGSGLHPSLFVKALAEGLHFGHSTVLVNRERTMALGGFDESQLRRHDIDHWLRVVRGHTWAYEATPAAGYRIATPGGISTDAVACELYYLRALLRAQDSGYEGDALTELVRTSARRSMSLSWARGSAEQRNEARERAWSHLTPAYRLFYRAAGLLPRAFRCALRTKHGVRAWFHPEEQTS